MRSKSRWPLLCAMVVMMMCCALAAQSQVLTKTRDIRENPKGYANEIVTLEGFATQWVEGKSNTTSFYFLKDDWGGIIKIRTSQDPPLVGERYRVTGPVGIDPTNHNDVYVSEEMRIHIRDETASGIGTGGKGLVPTAIVDSPPPKPKGFLTGFSQQELILIGAIAFVVLLLIAIIIWHLRSKTKTRPTEPPTIQGQGSVGPPPAPPPSGPPPAGPPPKVIEGGTIKMHAPPPGTLKILPGRLEITAGDDVVKEIRFYRAQGQSTPEVTFGRAAGAPFTHIQLKPMTVSSRQAKMTFINKQWVLTNFAAESSNPTRYNGQPLPVEGETVLQEGDKVEMGEVEMIFHVS
jgi:hypothetical protein